MTRRYPLAPLLIASTFALVPSLVAPRCTAQEAPLYGAPAAGVAVDGLQVAATPTQPAQLPGQSPVAPASAAPQQPAAAVSQPPAPPFQLTDVEQQFVVQVLKMWETESAKIKTFNSAFERWEYDAVFGPGIENPLIKSSGTLSFSKPDKGSLKVDSISRWTKKNPQDTAADAPGDWVPQPHEVGEHWVCDGKAVYEYNHRDKQLVVTNIPEEMRGKSIVDGPLPFLFGAEANKLMQRYWIRSELGNPAEIWLKAYPRWQSDAANYDCVDVMLDRKTMQPKAIQVHLPGGQQRHVYMFKDPKVNESNLGTWFSEMFSAPRKPLGWERVTNEQPPGPQAPGPQAANPPAAIQR